MSLHCHLKSVSRKPIDVVGLLLCLPLNLWNIFWKRRNIYSLVLWDFSLSSGENMEETFPVKREKGKHSRGGRRSRTQEDNQWCSVSPFGLKNPSVCCPSEHKTIPRASVYEQNGHGKRKAYHVLITGEAKFQAALEDQQLENRPGSLRISILELLATTAVRRSPGLCSLHLNGFHNARLSIYWTNV